jgi:RNA polymerase sigma-70 factor (ECF subfamily)
MMPIRELSMTDPSPGNKLVAPQPGSADEGTAQPLLSDEPTIELVLKARGGDRAAVEALLQRCLPSLRRWTHGRLPPAARANLDTEDLVQETALHVIRRLDKFEPQHVGSMQAYLRQSVINRIRDEVRRIARHPAPVELLDDQVSDQTSPLEAVLKTEAYERYRHALNQLDSRDREIIVARIEVQWSLPEIARQFQTKTVDAARMRVTRALRRLTDRLSNR